MKIGYIRVSTQEQHEALQIDALKEAGCEKWFVDKMTGSKAERKGLDEALARRMFDEQSHSLSEICAALGISHATLYRYVKEATSSVSDS